jgi:hypothetical protein
MRKKFAFAQSLVHAPQILLLYEALNGIDAMTVSRIKGPLRRLASLWRTIILSRAKRVEKRFPAGWIQGWRSAAGEFAIRQKMNTFCAFVLFTTRSWAAPSFAFTTVRRAEQSK